MLFNVEYPEIVEGLQPRYRFMSAYEQRKEAPDKDWQYLLFAAEPYETIAFKIPNWDVDKDQVGNNAEAFSLALTNRDGKTLLRF